MQKTKIYPVRLFSILILVIIVEIGLFIFGLFYLQKINEEKFSPILLKYNFYNSINNVFNKITEKYSVSESDKMSLWWISPDGLNIINDNSSGIELKSFNCLTDNESKTTFKEMAKTIGLGIEETMKRDGFKKNEKNSSKSVDDESFYDYIQAYEKNLLKVIFKADPDCASDSDKIPVHYSFSLEYTTSFEDNYKQQAKYLEDLGIRDAIIHIQKKAGDFIYLNVNYRRSGYYLVAKQVNGKWKKLIAGQDYPSCDEVFKYKIPKEIISDCYTANPMKLIPVL